jgi:hypothetical protein
VEETAALSRAAEPALALDAGSGEVPPGGPKKPKRGLPLVIVIAVVALLAVGFAVAALLGVFSTDRDNTAAPGIATSPTVTATDTDTEGTPSDTDAPDPLTDEPAEPTGDTPADPDEGTSGAEGSETTASADPSTQASADTSGEAAAEGDYCALFDQAQATLGDIQADPNDLDGMAESIEAYVDALTRTREAAPKEIRTDLDVILDYWGPLLEAARNPLSAAGGLTSTRTAEEYSEAWSNLYVHHGTECAAE